MKKLIVNYHDIQKGNKVPILFRKEVLEIPSTTYGVFSIYKYPAKFIPQVIAFVLREYGEAGTKVFDPFAGYGTVGLVSKIYGYDYELWDLNPILEIIHKTAVLGKPKVKLENLLKIIDDIKTSNKEFIPEWKNLFYWFPEDFIPVLSKAWGFVHFLDEEYKYYFLIPLLKVTKYFSFCDEKVHKLHRSRYSVQKIKHLLKENWKNIFYKMLKNETAVLFNKLNEYENLRPQVVNYKIRAGVDTLTMDLEEPVDILITSPPYLQAQEYIRSTKLELFWLGYEENFIRNLQKLEIPYREVPEINIDSPTYYKLYQEIKENHLRRIYKQYFNAILSIFSNLSKKVKGYMCIFVGPAKIRNIPIPIDDIIVEHLKNFGWEHKVTFVDKIVSRVMFESKINPANKMKDKRIETEHLIILKNKN
jgi:DNA modification methylase